MKGAVGMAEARNVIESAVANPGIGEGKYLTFALSSEEYGIGIMKVREIIGMMAITPVPRTPVFLRGVINLHGKAIPVVDLRRKFGMGSKDLSDRTCIIVVDTAGQAGAIQMGMLVDAVSGVLNIKGADFEEPLCFREQVDMDNILGMATIGQGVKILLDVDKVLNGGYMGF